MSAAPRDLLKTRDARVGEVYSLLHLGAGQANGQLVSYGCTISAGAGNNTITYSAGAIVMGGAETLIAGLASQAVTGGAATSASQFLKVLLEVDATNTLYQIVGAPVTTQQSDAVLPKGVATHISIGYLAIPVSFVPGTTVITTAGIINQMPYWGSSSTLSGI
jgi:hypothetical protein